MTIWKSKNGRAIAAFAVGAAALAAVACGSSVTGDEVGSPDGAPGVDTAPPQSPPSLGMPAPGFGGATVEEMVVVGDGAAGNDTVPASLPSQGIAIGEPVFSKPSQPIAIGEPVSGGVRGEVNVRDLPSTEPGGSGSGFAPAIPPTVVPGLPVDGGPVSLGMPAPGFLGSGVDEMVVVGGGSGGSFLPGDSGEPKVLPRPAGTDVVPAPVESAEVVVAESGPPLYFLRVVTGLPNGATTFGGYDVERDGEIVSVNIVNFVKPDVFSTQVYGTQESNIALGSDFEPGQPYVVVVNGEPFTQFIAQ